MANATQATQCRLGSEQSVPAITGQILVPAKSRKIGVKYVWASHAQWESHSRSERREDRLPLADIERVGAFLNGTFAHMGANIDAFPSDDIDPLDR